MDRSDQPTEFRGAIRGRQSRTTAYVVAGGIALVVGLGILAGTLGDATGPAPTRGPDASDPITAASPTSTRTPRPSGPSTPRPSRAPTPTPTPAPTLAPVAARVTSAGLSPTGVLVADTGDRSLGSLVPDANGTVWTSRGGALVNVDPQTGRTRQWTIADDAAFATSSLAASPGGGVWLLGSDAIRLFDGERFRAVIDLPTAVWMLVETPDGALWAQGEPYGLIRWVDGVWRSDPPGRPGRGAASLVVDDAGRVWTADYDLSFDGSWIGRGISTWDGEAWTSYDLSDLLSTSSGETPGLYTGPGGTVWALTGYRFASFDDRGWTAVQLPDFAGKGYPAAVGPDGRIWFTGEGCDTCPVRVNVFDGSGWTEYDDTDGLPGADAVGGAWSTLLVGSDYALAATEAGLYRLAGERWSEVALSGPSVTTAPLPARIASLAAVSRDEAWAVTQTNDPYTGAEIASQLVRFDGAAWREERLPIKTTARQVVVAPDGALWVATDAGPFVRRGGRWVGLGDTVAEAVPFPMGNQEAPSCGAAIAFGEGGVVYYTGQRTASRVVALVPRGTSWDASLHSAPRISPECASSMAVTHDGTVWILQRGWGSILSRSSGEPWENVQPRTAASPNEISPSAMAVDADGSLWTVGSTWDPAANTGRAVVAQLVGDEWVSRGEAPGVDFVGAMALRPDGSIVVAGNGIAVFDRGEWRRGLANMWFELLSIAPDGTTWVFGPNVYRLPATLP